MAPALVTGASGFLGRELVAELVASREEVHGVGRGERPSGWRGERWHRCDLLDRDGVRAIVAEIGPGRVFHVAGTAGGSLGGLLDANVVATGNVLSALVEAPGAAALVAGSSAEVGAVPAARQPIGEDEPLRPVSDYGVAKAAQCLLVGRHAATGTQRIVYARTFNLVGPGLPRTLAPAAFAAQAAEAEAGLRPPVIETGYLGASRDYVDVRDVARAYRLLLADEACEGVYNVCSGVATPVRSLLEHLLAAAAVPLEVHEVAALGDAPSDVASQVGNPARLREATGWAPEIPLEASLRDLLDGYRRAV